MAASRRRRRGSWSRTTDRRGRIGRPARRRGRRSFGCSPRAGVRRRADHRSRHRRLRTASVDAIVAAIDGPRLRLHDVRPDHRQRGAGRYAGILDRLAAVRPPPAARRAPEGRSGGAPGGTRSTWLGRFRAPFVLRSPRGACAHVTLAGIRSGAGRTRALSERTSSPGSQRPTLRAVRRGRGWRPTLRHAAGTTGSRDCPAPRRRPAAGAVIHRGSGTCTRLRCVSPRDPTRCS